MALARTRKWLFAEGWRSARSIASAGVVALLIMATVLAIGCQPPESEQPREDEKPWEIDLQPVATIRAAAIPSPFVRDVDSTEHNVGCLAHGGRIESVNGRIDFPGGAAVMLDGRIKNYWQQRKPSYPFTITVSFRDRRMMEIRRVEIDQSEASIDRASLPRKVRILVSEQSATKGFRQVGAAIFKRTFIRPYIQFAEPVRARFLRLCVLSNHGSDISY